jgi:hypothetical protein
VERKNHSIIMTVLQLNSALGDGKELTLRMVLVVMYVGRYLHWCHRCNR